jgi:hypothetical protein
VKRREFIGLVGGAAAWPLTASAQRAAGKIVTIGILAIEPWPPIDTFRQALDDLGYIEGKNVRFEYRYAKGHNERFPELANDLVGLNVDVILTWGTDAVLAAKQATTTIPIVMGVIGDPLGSGIVTNLARPGGNVTGATPSHAGHYASERGATPCSQSLHRRRDRYRLCDSLIPFASGGSHRAVRSVFRRSPRAVCVTGRPLYHSSDL